MRDDPVLRWLLIIMAVFVLSIVSYGVYLAQTTRRAAYDYQLVLVPVDDGMVLTPMKTACARRVPK